MGANKIRTIERPEPKKPVVPPGTTIVPVPAPPAAPPTTSPPSGPMPPKPPGGEFGAIQESDR